MQERVAGWGACKVERLGRMCKILAAQPRQLAWQAEEGSHHRCGNKQRLSGAYHRMDATNLTIFRRKHEDTSVDKQRTPVAGTGKASNTCPSTKSKEGRNDETVQRQAELNTHDNTGRINKRIIPATTDLAHRSERKQPSFPTYPKLRSENLHTCGAAPLDVERLRADDATPMTR